MVDDRLTDGESGALIELLWAASDAGRFHGPETLVMLLRLQQDQIIALGGALRDLTALVTAIHAGVLSGFDCTSTIARGLEHVQDHLGFPRTGSSGPP